MENIQYIYHKGKQILHHSYIDEKDLSVVFERLNKTKQMILAKPPKSVLLLSDVTNCYFDTELISQVKLFSKEITPHIKASAVVGVTGLYLVFFKTIVTIARRDIGTPRTIEEGKEWLVNQ